MEDRSGGQAHPASLGPGPSLGKNTPPFSARGEGEYLKYGYWMRSFDDGEDDDTSGSVYFRTSHPVASDIAERRSGSATYTGGTLGIRRSRTNPGDAGREGTFSGTFTLTADFDAETIGGHIDPGEVDNLKRTGSDRRFGRINLETTGLDGGMFLGDARFDGDPSSEGRWQGAIFADGSLTGGVYRVEDEGQEVLGSFGGSVRD